MASKKKKARPSRKAAKRSKNIQVLRTVKDSFIIFKKNPVLFVPVVLFALLQVASYFLVPDVSALYAMQDNEMAALSLSQFAIMIASMMIAVLMVKMAHDSTSKKFSFMASLKASPGKFLKGIGIFVINFVLIITLSLLFVPTLFIPVETTALLTAIPYTAVAFLIFSYVLIRLSMALFGAVIDNKGLLQSFKYSWNITKGSVVRMFSVNLLVFLIFWAIAFVATSAAIVAMGSETASVAASGFSYVISPLIFGVGVAANVLMYSKLKR